MLGIEFEAQYAALVERAVGARSRVVEEVYDIAVYGAAVCRNSEIADVAAGECGIDGLREGRILFTGCGVGFAHVHERDGTVIRILVCAEALAGAAAYHVHPGGYRISVGGMPDYHRAAVGRVGIVDVSVLEVLDGERIVTAGRTGIRVSGNGVCTFGKKRFAVSVQGCTIEVEVQQMALLRGRNVCTAV